MSTKHLSSTKHYRKLGDDPRWNDLLIWVLSFARLLYPESTCASCNAPLDTSELLFNPISPNLYCTRNRSPDHLSLRCVYETCGQKFRSLANLKEHFRTSWAHASFNCAIPGCGESLIRWDASRHFSARHKDVKYHCAQCGTGFDTIHQLDGHGKDTMHSAYVCGYPECGSESTRSGEMNRHHLGHRQSVPRHPCPHCRK
jgi:general transcription factor IIIA